MLEPKILEINGKSCHLEYWKWDDYPTDVNLEYIEHASDHWSSDSHTSVKIDLEMAKNIIAFLKDAFEIKEQL